MWWEKAWSDVTGGRVHIVLYGFHNGAGEKSYKQERENTDENQVNNGEMEIHLEQKLLWSGINGHN